MNKKQYLFYLIVIALFCVGWAIYLFPQLNFKVEKDPFEAIEGIPNTKSSVKYGVSATHPLAVEAGIEALEKGGNAVDAAIATAYVLGVVEPYGSGIGGGGGMLIKPGNDEKEPIFIDYREVAPDTNQKNAGEIAVPGFVRGMEEINKKYGTLPMSELIQPSIDIARDGFKVTKDLHIRLKEAQYRLPVGKLAHFFPNGEAKKEKDVLKQVELADTLQLIQKEGANGFYKGSIAESIKEVSSINSKDMGDYTVEYREPVFGEFNQYKILSAPAPFAGITLIQSLQMMDLLNIENPKDHLSSYMGSTAKIIHTTYRDRLSHIGDPDFVQVDNDLLTSKAYSKKLAEKIDNKHLEDFVEEEEHESTTHFVVIDSEGTIVSTTNSLSEFFGSGVYINGFFLNNNLYNFAESTRSPNSYEPGKRARTFTAPTIVYNDDLDMGIGTPGGNRIPTILVEVLVPFLKYEQPLNEVVIEPRFFVDKNVIYTESMFPPDLKNELKKFDFQIEYNSRSSYYGSIQALVIDRAKQSMYGVGDKRRDGTWKVKIIERE